MEPLLTKATLSYARDASQAEPTLLQALRATTNAHVHSAQMLSSPLQGRTLAFLSKLIRPTRILEIGTFTGYSALCLAEGLVQDGTLHTLEQDKKLLPIIEPYFAQAPTQGKLICHIGQAQALIPTIEGPFELVFIDADKRAYPTYYDMVVDRIPPGGLIIADNVLWKGMVATPEARASEQRAQAMFDFNAHVADDPRVEQLLLPIEDGLLLIHKN